MSIYIDADVIVRWEKREFDLPGWILENAFGVEMGVPATVWQQLQFGIFDWEPPRAAKRKKYLEALGSVPVIPFNRAHAVRAAASPLR